MPGWPRLPSVARSYRTWVSLMLSASPSPELDTREVPSRSRPSRRRRYRLSRPTLARDRRLSGELGRFRGSPVLDMLALTRLLSVDSPLSLGSGAEAVKRAPGSTWNVQPCRPTESWDGSTWNRPVESRPSAAP